MMALSATGRGTRDDVFALDADDIEEDGIVRKRVKAPKWLKLEEETAPGDLAQAMAGRAIELAEGQRRVLVFCNSRKVAGNVFDVLEDYLKRTFGRDAAEPGTNLELIVGARRERERERLADSLVFRRFAHQLSDEERAVDSSPGLSRCYLGR
jgi:hypothetical protein